MNRNPQVEGDGGKLGQAAAAVWACDGTQLGDRALRLESVETGRGRSQYCVRGYVSPAIWFELLLPINRWCDRLLMVGAGGYAGGGTDTDLSRFSDESSLVKRSEFAIVTADSGHQRAMNRMADGAWALGNPAALRDFAYDSTHCVLAAARRLTRAFYDRPPQYCYFVGCSNGGRQGLQEVQRFPLDFDGVAAICPTIDKVTINTFYHAWNAAANTGSDGKAILAHEKLPALHASVLEEWGRDQGGVGDMIADPRVAAIHPRSLARLASSAGLTPAELEVVAKLYHGPRDPYGRLLAPGGVPVGSELSWAGSIAPAGGERIVSEQTMSECMWATDFPNYMCSLGGATGLTYRTISFTEEEFDRLNELSGLYDPTDPELTAFRDRHGKLLIWQGWADALTPPLGALNYYDQVRRSLGESADQVISLYMVPGAYHCGAGPTPTHADVLGALVSWVEDGVLPGRIDVTYQPGEMKIGTLRVRPVFPYPYTSRYTGSGDPADGSNFVQGPPITGVSDQCEWLGLRHYTPEHTRWLEISAATSAVKPARSDSPAI
jgi:hypothetical protein